MPREFTNTNPPPASLHMLGLPPTAHLNEKKRVSRKLHKTLEGILSTKSNRTVHSLTTNVVQSTYEPNDGENYCVSTRSHLPLTLQQEGTTST